MPNSIEPPSNSWKPVYADDRKKPNTEALDIAGTIYCMGFEDGRNDFADSFESCDFGARLITDLVISKIAESEQRCKALVCAQTDKIAELEIERDEWEAKYKSLLRALDGKTYVLDFWKDGDTCHVITTDGEEIYDYQKWLEDHTVVFEK